MAARFTEWLLTQDVGFDRLRAFVEQERATLAKANAPAVRAAITGAGLPSTDQQALVDELEAADLAHRAVLSEGSQYKAGIGAYVGIGLLLLVAAALIFMAIRPNLVQLLARPEMARGMITSVFALSVVAIATVIVCANFLSVASDLKERVEQGREVMLALVGILGTIVGYYFAAGQGPVPLSVSPPQVAPASPTPGQAATVAFAIAGGAAPFTWVLDATVTGEAEGTQQPLDKTAQTANPGVVLVSSDWPTDAASNKVTLTVTVIDGTGTRVTSPESNFPPTQ